VIALRFAQVMLTGSFPIEIFTTDCDVTTVLFYNILTVLLNRPIVLVY